MRPFSAAVVNLSARVVLVVEEIRNWRGDTPSHRRKSRSRFVRSA